jgi:Zn-dependent M28 family amino/carboxypeptidase
LALALMLAGPTSAPAGSKACPNRVNNTFDKLLECVTLDGVRAHQAALQAVADANGGTRAAGTPGYADSVDYVAETLVAAGYDVTLDPFEFEFVPPSTLRQTAPVEETYETDRFTGSGTGTVAGPVIPVDLALGNGAWPADPSTTTSGCEASDFAGLDFSGPNDIALIQRGTCFFSTKAVNAEAAGAEAVIIFNQGNAPTRLGLIVGTAESLPDGSPSNLTIPVVGASFAQGEALAAAGAEAVVVVDPIETRVDYNVLAELPGRNNDNVVMAGAHLDSVPEGPGIQDNGSGSAALLEIAVQMRKVKPRNTLRFAWWGAEESGLVGSSDYVNGLSAEELDAIAAYIDVHMIGSPNFVRFVYDGDGSEGGTPGPDGSGAIEQFFEDFYSARGLPFKPLSFDGRSDYAVFLGAGIPAGGLFTGAEVIKTADEAAIFGGTAGEQFDPCYHLACDTFDNISLEVLEQNTQATAAAVLQWSMNTEAINGVKGKGNFKP